ncbi:MAG TPA: N-formylglutamate deformylase [Woeseiaceae bacterium]|nr:N-formylglutamate deformylase [Woeseiaceae bacterium]
MSDVYRFVAGDSPLLVSVPHDGRLIPDAQRARMTAAGLAIPDTDWHVAELYDFARELGASLLVAEYSRYVVDLNRPPDNGSLYAGQVSTGLCPQYTFAGEALYREDAPVPGAEVAERTGRYWRPYHARLELALDELRARHGCAFLWDAHSIPSRVPRLFDGELPVLNLGSFDDRSCDPGLAQALHGIATASPYESVLNGRFRGGYITRHYGKPANGVQAMQLELAQRAYMDEETLQFDAARARRLRDTLRALLVAFIRYRPVQ